MATHGEVTVHVAGLPGVQAAFRDAAAQCVVFTDLLKRAERLMAHVCLNEIDGECEDCGEPWPCSTNVWRLELFMATGYGQ
jgi:hypothetical protein